MKKQKEALKKGRINPPAFYNLEFSSFSKTSSGNYNLTTSKRRSPSSRKNIANWTIQWADRYLAILYDYPHEKMYDYHVLQADETPVLVNKDGNPKASGRY